MLSVQTAIRVEGQGECLCCLCACIYVDIYIHTYINLQIYVIRAENKVHKSFYNDFITHTYIHCEGCQSHSSCFIT